jgi:putative DNA primase/helicase
MTEGTPNNEVQRLVDRGYTPEEINGFTEEDVSRILKYQIPAPKWNGHVRGVDAKTDGAFDDPDAPPTRDADVALALNKARENLRKADNDLARLHAIRGGAEALERIGDDGSGAFDRLSELAINVYGVNADDVQKVLTLGIERAREARSSRRNGNDRQSYDAHRDYADSHSGTESQRSRGKRQAPNDTEPGTLESAKASAYQMRAIQWFWPNRFARGKFGIIGGMPDRGKGQIAASMMARGTRGDLWPCNEGRAPQGNVILFTAEDDIEDTVVPRLVGADADLDRVHIVKMVRQGDDKRMFNLVTDLDLLRQKIAEVSDVVLVIIDPVSAYMGVGKMDSYRTTDVRGVLGPLKELAEETMVSIIGIMHFNKKSDVKEVMLRIADSLAYVAAARHCYVVVGDTDNNRRLFVKAKNNLAPDMAGLSYTVDTKLVGKDPYSDEQIFAPHIVWGSDHVTITASEAMEAETGTKTKTSAGARDAAKQFLTERLAVGPVSKKEIDEEAEANGISRNTLYRAKDDLGIVVSKEKGALKGGWVWELPSTRPQKESD